MTKILLVEDNEMNRDMLSRRLERRRSVRAGGMACRAVDSSRARIGSRPHTFSIPTLVPRMTADGCHSVTQ
jgi:CheY-like chemotaxis protein